MIEDLRRDMTDEQSARALELAGEIGRLLQGQGGWVQGSCLADLVSMWLAGIYPLGVDQAEQHRIRLEVFAEWCELVLKLLPASIAQVMSGIKPEGSA